MNRNIQSGLRAILEDAVASGIEHGCQCAVYRHGVRVASVCAGCCFPGGEPVTPETLFPVFSAGKGVMATLLHLLVERGRTSYDEYFRDRWCAFDAGGREKITLFHVLSHQSGMHRMPEVNAITELADWDLMCSRLTGMSPEFVPGTRMQYQALTFSWLAGEFAARAAGGTMPELLQNEVLRPLGLDQIFYFGLDDEAEGRISLVARGREMPPERRFRNMACYLPVERIPADPVLRRACLPAAGAFASAEGLSRLYAGLFEGFLSTSTLDRASVLQLPSGWSLPDDPQEWTVFGLGYGLLGGKAHPGEILGHNGYGGAAGFFDRKTGYAVGFTKNDLHPVDDITRRKVCSFLGIDYRNY